MSNLTLTPNVDSPVIDTKSIKKLKRRRAFNRFFKTITVIATIFSVLCLVVLLTKIFWNGAANINWKFLTSFVSRKAEDAGIIAALAGTLWLIVLTGLFSIPLGIGSSVFIQ